MNIHDLREAQVRHENRKEEILNSRKELYQLRSKFIKYFNRNKIFKMEIDDYVIGVHSHKNNSNLINNFCYGLERQLDGLGRTLGATAFKFGVYYGQVESDKTDKYRFVKKFGTTHQEAFQNVKTALIELINSGENEKIEEIVENPLSPMFKGKILSTYFPDRYLNIFSDKHLNFFISQFDLDTVDLINKDPVYKREALFNFKNQDPVMQNWSMDMFVTFLYTEYPIKHVKENQQNITHDGDPLAGYRTPNFPPNQSPTFIDLEILSPTPTKTVKSNHSSKINYEKQSKNNQKLGDRGEMLVMELEKSRLSNAGKSALVDKIERVSLKSDAYGYDIVSFDEDGKERYIEVKATQSKPGATNFFFTENELQTAQKHQNYYIYIVYEITTDKPKVWAIKNPFNPQNENVVKQPIKYRVTINA